MHQRPPRARLTALTAAAIAALTAAFCAALAIGGHAARTSAPAPAATRVTAVAAAVVSRGTPPRAYTVRPGDTLSGIAARLCGQARDWTGIYHASRGTVGPDPNQITAGERLAIACYDPPALLSLGRAAPRPAARTAARAAALPATGTYSYTALENLWITAGGPAWAAPHAASIAICESGGNPRAYNPSGATGLFQILGSVVPGNLDDPYVNALNAVAKFKAAGDTFSAWVCK